ncbi:hypothetical protein GCM10010937_14320 [Gluconobacter japonicus]|uniref:Uncharacterized protein n=1 Tax=Gluconobacter japonicus TaxID=376620 RepID=A0ABQ5WIQ9_GLUJA|nr:hypothetical protein GCM10010937_14320 [Gluconobacter japonicus]
MVSPYAEGAEVAWPSVPLAPSFPRSATKLAALPPVNGARGDGYSNSPEAPSG